MTAVPDLPPATAPVVAATGLTRHYRVRRHLFGGTATLKAVEDATFTVAARQTLAVVGESGCGKSTLARLITLIEPPTAGHCRLDGQEITTASRAQRRRLRRVVQMVFQDPYGSLNPRKTAGAILSEPLKINTALKAPEREARVREMLSVVGLRQEHYHRYPHMFSGGQRQRIAIARALILNPKLVVADEPVSALDVSVQAQVLNLMIDLQEAYHLAYIFIAHDLSVVRHIADAVMVMYLGRPVEQGEKLQIFTAPAHPYTRALLASTPAIEPGQRRERIALRGEPPSPLDPPPGCSFHRRCPFAQERCAAEVPTLRQVAGRAVACHRAEEI